ncbi:MAG: MurT ligase domain-containing protein [Candidatus Dormibacteraceae bacterium]
MIRQAAAVLAGKATGGLSRLSRRGAGATFPGDVARAVDPGVLRKLAAGFREGAVLITGTNGKTTTSRLVASLLERPDRPVVANRTGANLIWGATAAAVQAASASGRLRADWGVFEIDEATLPQAVEEIRPRAVLVGNLFRDQLDRYGELETLAQRVGEALATLPRGSRVVLNADDPRLGWMGAQLDTAPLWYGLDDRSVSAPTLPHAADARTCPRCGTALEFTAVYVGHDGEYVCPRGDFRRPRLDVAGTEIRLEGLEGIHLRAAGTPLQTTLGGLYNAYNLVGAFALGTALALPAAEMAERLRHVPAAFGRQERFEHGGLRFTMLLAKNPTGFNESLRGAVELAGGRHHLIALNDRVADGRDVSWIWDVDFEVLRESAEVVVPSGERSGDLAIRLKYGRVSAATDPESDLARALDTLIERMPVGAEAHLLCTYTAMLDLRAELVRRGWAKPYWASR